MIGASSDLRKGLEHDFPPFPAFNLCRTLTDQTDETDEMAQDQRSILDSTEIITYRMPMKGREEILRQVEQFLRTRQEILFAYAHGSFIEAPFFRDLDIAVFLKQKDLQRVRYTYEIGLEDALEKILTVNFPLEVRLLNSASVAFQYKAIGGRLLVDRDPDLRVDFWTRVISRYLDIKPILLYHTKEAFSYEARP